MPELWVRRDRLDVCQVVEPETAPAPADGEALLEVQRFALTTNTITYALLGDRLGYWRVFPAAAGWGRIPAWGYARVAASRAADVVEGQQVFGLVPMGTGCLVRPVARGRAFTDVTPHRASLSPVYNQYLRVDDDSDHALVMRPLFGTAVVLDLHLAETALADADTVVLTSASSKTAYALAHLLRSRPVRVTGLTSPARRGWLAGLGLYDTVLDYGQVDRLAAAGGAVLVDFAADPDTLRAVRQRLGPSLRRTIQVGFTHVGAGRDGATPPDPAAPTDPAGEFFFAPDEMVRRGRELTSRYAQTWPDFVPILDRAMRVVTVRGVDELRQTYLNLLAGRVDPAVGYVATLA